VWLPPVHFRHAELSVLARIRPRTGLKRQLSLTSWPRNDNLAHPSPYTSVEICAVVLRLAILCADVMTVNSAGDDRRICNFVLGVDTTIQKYSGPDGLLEI
jgi:hypothetical protein